MSNKKLYEGRKGTLDSLARASRNSIKRRKPLNRYILEKETENVNSAKKLKSFQSYKAYL